MTAWRLRVESALWGGWLGASAWISLGTLAITGPSTGTRVGALPPVWAFAALVLLGAGAGALLKLTRPQAWSSILASLIWLPWLPFRVPRAFLLWNGPLEGLVWCVVLFGLVFAFCRQVRARLPRIAIGARQGPWLAAAVAAAVSLTVAWSIASRVPAGDEPHYLVITQSLLLDGDLRIENNHRRDDYLAYYPFELRRPDFMRRGTDGEIYSVHLPGLSALLLPAFAVAGYAGALVSVVLLSAAASGLAWHAAWLLTRDTAAAWVGWAGVALSAPVVFHSFTIYPDTVGAVMVMVVVWHLVRADTSGAPLSPATAAVLGALLAGLPWLHTRFAMLAAGFGVAVVLRVLPTRARWHALAAFALPPIVAGAAWLGYFWIIYGRPDPSLPYNGLGQNDVATLWRGLPGLFVDQQFGVLVSAPVLALASLGAVPLWRRMPRLTSELALISAPYLLAVGSYGMWWAGFSAPARFLLVLLWPLALPLAMLWHQTRLPLVRSALITAIALGLVLVLGRACIDGGGLLYNSRDGYDLLLDWASRTVNLPLAFPSVHRDGPQRALLDAATWLAVLLAIGVGLGPVAGRARRTGELWAIAAHATALWLMVASTIVWARRDGAVLTPSTSQLAFLRELQPNLLPTPVEFRPGLRVDPPELFSRLRLTSSERGATRVASPILLQIPQLPAGEYQLLLESARRPAGRLSLALGRTEQRLQHWELGEELPSLRLRLPVRAHSVTIYADEEARDRVTQVSLRPLSVARFERPVDEEYARRATIYGDVRAFFLDDNAFMEPPGFWTRGGAKATVVLERADLPGDTHLRLRSGAVPSRIRLSTGGLDQEVELGSGEVRDVKLPASAEGRAFRLEITASSGFRPSEVDRASADLRYLGVWVEFP